MDEVEIRRELQKVERQLGGARHQLQQITGQHGSVAGLTMQHALQQKAAQLNLQIAELETKKRDLIEQAEGPLRLPKTIDFTIDYLRAGLPRDAYARARVNRSGRRYASVHVEAWQDNRARLFAQATGHFLMPLAEPKP